MKAKILPLFILVMLSCSTAASSIPLKEQVPANAFQPKYVEVISLDGKLIIKWDIPSEYKAKEFLVYRTTKMEPGYRLIAKVNNKYFVDKDVINKTKYSYMIRAVDVYDNYSDFSKVVSGIPTDLDTRVNEVFIMNDTISLLDPQELILNIIMAKDKIVSKVNVTIYDSEKRPVKSDALSVKKRNSAFIYRWNLKNRDNQQVPAGLYFVEVKAASWELVKQFSIVR